MSAAGGLAGTPPWNTPPPLYPARVSLDIYAGTGKRILPRPSGEINPRNLRVRDSHQATQRQGARLRVIRVQVDARLRVSLHVSSFESDLADARVKRLRMFASSDVALALQDCSHGLLSDFFDKNRASRGFRSKDATLDGSERLFGKYFFGRHRCRFKR